ncbi:MAG TPA: MBL fold metallo-hydrolase [Sphingomonadaceae bacterium]|nr:MBL fold metallo-hydrolase [Sphingomonadaceae bacterium]
MTRRAGYDPGMRILLAGIALLAAAPVAAQEPFVIIPGHIDLAIGPDGNTIVLDAPDGLIVIDSGRHAAHSEAILAHAEEAGRPIAAIVNSHWHLDHTTGNVDLRRAFPAAELIATGAAEGALTGFLAEAPANARRRIDDPASSEDDRTRASRTLAILTEQGMLVPAVPVTESGVRIIAGRKIELHVAPSAVTEADLWLLVPDEHLAIVGDLVVAQSPFFDTGCEEGWEAALDAIGAAQWDTLIPGHGAPMDRAGFARWRTAFSSFVACSRSDAAAEACADGWERDAAGFFTEAEAPSVRELSRYYIAVLRSPPEQRMDYCLTSR